MPTLDAGSETVTTTPCPNSGGLSAAAGSSGRVTRRRQENAKRDFIQDSFGRMVWIRATIVPYRHLGDKIADAHAMVFF